MSTYILSQDGELYHYGVKGQKWGVRRYQNKDGTLTAAGKKRQQKLERRQLEQEQLGRVRELDDVIRRAHSNSEGDDWDKADRARDELYKTSTIMKTFNNRLSAAVKDRIGIDPNQTSKWSYKEVIQWEIL